MSMQKPRTLDDLFAGAKNVPSVISDDAMESIVSDQGAPGRSSLRRGNGSPLDGPRPHHITSHIRGRIMTFIALTVAVATLGYGVSQMIVPGGGRLADHGGTASRTESPATIAGTTAPKSAPVVVSPEPAVVPGKAPATNRPGLPTTHEAPTTDARRDLPQEPGDKTRELGEKFAEGVAQEAMEYWTNRINDYKQRIDGMMTTSDLNDLNRLRVKWAFVTRDEVSPDRPNSMSMSFSMRSTPDSLGNGVVIPPGGTKITLHSVVQDEEMNQAFASAPSVEVIELDGESWREFKSQTSMPSQDLQGIMALLGRDTTERGVVLTDARGLATKYRRELDALKGDILGDFSEFLNLVSGRASTFLKDHAEELEGTELEKLRSHEEKLRDMVASIGPMVEGNPMLMMLYTSVFEPQIMLYNGSEINSLISSSVTEPVAGVKLPESRTLGQNFPNPASAKTSIRYTLQEPSSSTTIRLFDAAGNVVTTIDEGARPAGEHTATVDVSGMQNGTYLYHLTLHTSHGEQVHSKTMQVVR